MSYVSALVLPVSFAALAAGHQLGDYWLQTSAQASRKGLPGREGRRACAAHVATYLLAQAAFTALAFGVTGLPVTWWKAVLGLALSGSTHYLADRRSPLRKIAAVLGKDEFWTSGEGLASGAAYMDQAWHWCWIFLAAVVTAA